MKKFTFVLIAIGFLACSVKAQEVWSLQKCIDHALQNNITVKQFQINSQYQENQLSQAKMNRLPDVTAGVSQNFSFGRSLTINNTYENYTSANTGFSANTSMLLYGGSQLRNTIKQRNFDLQVSQYDLQEARENLMLGVASAYLDILFAKELVRVAEQQVVQTQKQIERTTQLVEAGKTARGALLEIEAQLARENLELVNRNNNLQIANLTLAQLLELENYTNFMVEVPSFPELQAQASLAAAAEVFNASVLARPSIKSAEYKLKSSETQLDLAKAGYLPSLYLSAGLYDQFLTTSKYEVASFGAQLSDNHRESVVLNLSIPIFNRFQTKTNIANSKLQIDNQQLQLENEKKNLRKIIEQAYTAANAAMNRYAANKVAVHSMQESFRYVEEKFNVGMVNSVEYNDAKTNLAISESNLIQAKYDFIFRSKILDFYNGIPISLSWTN
jgi:outer membrane protein